MIYPRVKEETGKKRDRWRCERGETEDERDLNGKRGEEDSREMGT